MHIFHGKITRAGSSCSLWHIQTWKLGESRQGCCRTCGCVCDRPQDWETTGEWGIALPKPPASTEGDFERFLRGNTGSSICLAFVTLLILRMYSWNREAETALIIYNVYFCQSNIPLHSSHLCRGWLGSLLGVRVPARTWPTVYFFHINGGCPVSPPCCWVFCIILQPPISHCSCIPSSLGWILHWHNASSFPGATYGHILRVC